MSEMSAVAFQSDVSTRVAQLVKYVFFGGAAGLVTGIAVLFVVAVFYGSAVGLSPGACMLFACSATMLLSQPAGVAGMLSGATVGAVASAIVYYVHHHLPRPM
ncbi:MAG: hypothetical protein ABI886_11955 [Betaproteobacteria bacterium]